MAGVVTQPSVVQARLNFTPGQHGGGLHRRFLDDARRIASEAQPTPTPIIDTVLETAPGPDIQWHPSFETYEARVETLANLNIKRPVTVPNGFPEVVESQRTWSGADFADESSYILWLCESEVFEVERALSFFKSTSCPLMRSAITDQCSSSCEIRTG